jgi:hypothetical protein
MKKLTAFLAAMLMTLASAVLWSGFVSAQDRESIIRDKIEAMKAKRESREIIPSADRGMLPRNICVEFYTVDEIDEDPHVEMGNRFVLIGPNPHGDHWRLSPAGSNHGWEPGNYIAVPTIYDNVFDMWNVRAKGHSDDHYFRLTLEWYEGNDGSACPDYIWVTNLGHLVAPNLHPGHAGAGKGP